MFFLSNFFVCLSRAEIFNFCVSKNVFDVYRFGVLFVCFFVWFLCLFVCLFVSLLLLFFSLFVFTDVDCLFFFVHFCLFDYFLSL